MALSELARMAFQVSGRPGPVENGVAWGRQCRRTSETGDPQSASTETTNGAPYRFKAAPWALLGADRRRSKRSPTRQPTTARLPAWTVRLWTACATSSAGMSRPLPRSRPASTRRWWRSSLSRSLATGPWRRPRFRPAWRRPSSRMRSTWPSSGCVTGWSAPAKSTTNATPAIPSTAATSARRTCIPSSSN